MKKFMFIALLCAFTLTGAAGQSRTSAIVNHYAARNWLAGAVSAADIDTVLQAGIKAPSARNRQPWLFTVVRTQALSRRIIGDIVDGNVLIVVSALGDGKTNGAEILDCGLAVENMYLAAQAVGLGSRIYTGPMDTINGGLKTELGLPPGFSAVALVRIGRVQPGVDAVSAASNRKAAPGMIIYK